MSESKDDINVMASLKKGIITALATWVVVALGSGVVFYFAMLNFRDQQEKKNEELVKEISELKEELKNKVSQKDLENYTSAMKVQLNSISSAVENNNRQQDNMFNYLLNKPGK